MSRKIHELKAQRAAKVAELKNITSKAEAEKRFKSQKELTLWNEIKSKVEELDAEIGTLEEEERMALESVGAEFRKSQRSAGNKEFRNFNLGKAINEFSRGALTGLEAEVHQEGANELTQAKVSPRGLVIPEKVFRSFTAAANTGHNMETQGGYNVVADRGILAKLGVTIYENLTGQMNLVYSKGHNADFYDEGETVSEGTVTETPGKIQPRRIQGFSVFSNEFLAQAATTPEIMQDMAGAIEAATAKELFKEILALDALTGRGSSATGAALVWADLMKLKGTVKSMQFISPKFVAGGELFAHLEATSKDAGSGRYVIENGKVNAYPAVDAQGLMVPASSKHQIIFGDFKKASAGYFGGVEILVDPYSLSNKGQTKIVYNRIGDISVNPYAFTHISNATIA